MENITGINTDPSPYIYAAFGLGTVLLVGTIIYIFQHRSRLRALLKASKA